MHSKYYTGPVVVNIHIHAYVHTCMDIEQAKYTVERRRQLNVAKLSATYINVM